ncbi:MAG: HAMP domain-containing histidine kinase [Promethearchaeota archaeon]|nr:MAG: HAMP domain-containing histidine kinase [Candidatus Lokiarchaeota archaeon]
MPASDSQNSSDKHPILEIEKVITMENKKDNDYLSRMAHEFKGPLTKIYSAAQLLQNMTLEEDKKDLITFILDGSKKLIFMMNNLFEYFKDNDNIDNTLKKKKEDLVLIVNKVVEELQYFIEKRDHKFSISVPDKLIAKVDKYKMEQVFTNLLTNAIKYTPPKGIIELELKKKNHHIYFSITDNGIGIEKKDQKNLFKKFSVIRPNLEPNKDIFLEGTGLGLYLSKRIVDNHNGQIWVDSEGINKGATFFVKIPIED